MDRRDVFRIVGAGVAAGPAVFTAAAAYTPRALSAERYAALERMLEILLPADESGPSARDAGVAQYIDTTLFHGDDRTRAAWARGIDSIGHDVSTATLERIAANEKAPTSEAERFFVVFKQAAISAYYLSEAGRKSVGYHGDTAIHHFAGCTHPEHRGG